MPRSTSPLAVILTLAALFPAACQHITTMPPTESKLPPLVLKIQSTGKTVQLPTPVIISADLLHRSQLAWEKAGRPAAWPIILDDGRRAVLLVVAAKDGPRTIFSVARVSVFRPGGTLELEQINGPMGKGVPWPNRPECWTLYEPDGKTRKTEVTWYEDPVTLDLTTGLVLFHKAAAHKSYQINGDILEFPHSWSDPITARPATTRPSPATRSATQSFTQ